MHSSESMRATILLRCVVVVGLWAAGRLSGAPAKEDRGADPTLSAMRSVIEHYTSDHAALDRRYALGASPERAQRRNASRLLMPGGI